MQTINIPNHIAMVLDGNGRWAKKRGLSLREGHLAGVEAVRKIIEACVEKEVKILSLFALSSENLNRSKTEVSDLMQIYLDVLQNDTPKLSEQNVRLKFVGDRSVFAKEMQVGMMAIEEETSNHSGLTLIAALNYGGKWDIHNAAKQMALDFKNNVIDDLSIEKFNEYTSLGQISEPDLFIRTSGAMRISNFYLWQLAYSELYFTDVLWPDFDESQLDLAIQSYSIRKRNFGLRHE